MTKHLCSKMSCQVHVRCTAASNKPVTSQTLKTIVSTERRGNGQKGLGHSIWVLFYYQHYFYLNYCAVHLCYLVATSTGSKLALFQRWREWEYDHSSKSTIFVVVCGFVHDLKSMLTNVVTFLPK
jgi:hypothetical protein